MTRQPNAWDIFRNYVLDEDGRLERIVRDWTEWARPTPDTVDEDAEETIVRAYLWDTDQFDLTPESLTSGLEEDLRLELAFHLEREPAPPDESEFVPDLTELTWVDRLKPWVRRRVHNKNREAEALAQSKYKSAIRRHARSHEEWVARVEAVRHGLAEATAQAGFEHQRIEKVLSGYQRGETQAVRDLVEIIVRRVALPDPFRPLDAEVALGNEDSEVVVEFGMHDVDTVCNSDGSWFNGGRRLIFRRRRELAEALARAVTIRTLLEVFLRDKQRRLESVVVTGLLPMVDPSLGSEVISPRLSVRARAEDLDGVDFHRVDPHSYLRSLGAREADDLFEGPGISPVMRCSEGRSSSGEHSKISPYDFEHLVADLLRRMGLAAEVTPSSRDGGVDVRAYDPRPLIGGDILVQVKMYAGPVGVDAVRDLFGTLMSEGAFKALLVTNASFTTAAQSFAEGKPMELIDGPTLRRLAEEHGLRLPIHD